MSKGPSKRRFVVEDEPIRLPDGYVTARRIDLRQLWYAVMAVQERSVRRAAVALNIRQSTLSRQLHQLEDQIGIPLFVRSSGDVSPIRAGRDFLHKTANVLQEITEMVAIARSTGRGDAGRLFCQTGMELLES